MVVRSKSYQQITSHSDRSELVAVQTRKVLALWRCLTQYQRNPAMDTGVFMQFLMKLNI